MLSCFSYFITYISQCLFGHLCISIITMENSIIYFLFFFFGERSNLMVYDIQPCSTVLLSLWDKVRKASFHEKDKWKKNINYVVIPNNKTKKKKERKKESVVMAFGAFDWMKIVSEWMHPVGPSFQCLNQFSLILPENCVYPNTSAVLPSILITVFWSLFQANVYFLVWSRVDSGFPYIHVLKCCIAPQLILDDSPF